MTLEIVKVTNDSVLNTDVVGEEHQLKSINNCLPVCNPSICQPDTGECEPTHKP